MLLSLILFSVEIHYIVTDHTVVLYFYRDQLIFFSSRLEVIKDLQRNESNPKTAIRTEPNFTA